MSGTSTFSLLKENGEKRGLLMKVCLLTGDMEIGYGSQDVCATSSVMELHESRERVEKRHIRLIFRLKLLLDRGTVRISEPP